MLPSDMTRMVSVTVEHSVITVLDGDVGDMPLHVTDHWLLAKMQCENAGLKVIPDQWDADTIEVSPYELPDGETGFSVSVTARHVVGGQKTVRASATDLVEAKTLFWQQWNGFTRSSGCHSHLNCSKAMYTLTE